MRTLQDRDKFFSAEINALHQSFFGRGVLEGCEVTPAGGLLVDVAAGDLQWDDSVVSVANQQVAVTAGGPRTRYDLVVVDSGGTASVIDGDNNRGSPTLPSDRVLLAVLPVPADASSISADDILDARVVGLAAAGPQGPPGDFVNQWEGAWVEQAYDDGKLVRKDGSSYVATTDATDGDVPGVSSVWDLAAEKGDKGNKGDQGDKGSRWRGAWDSGTGYIVDDVVEHNGSSWIAINPSTNSEPSLASQDWDLHTSKGDQGDQGDQGDAGFFWNDAWEAKTYPSDSVVHHENDVHVATTDTTDGDTPGVDAVWEYVTRRFPMTWKEDWQAQAYDPQSVVHATSDATDESWVATTDTTDGDVPGQSAKWTAFGPPPLSILDLRVLLQGDLADPKHVTMEDQTDFETWRKASTTRPALVEISAFSDFTSGAASAYFQVRDENQTVIIGNLSGQRPRIYFIDQSGGVSTPSLKTAGSVTWLVAPNHEFRGVVAQGAYDFGSVRWVLL